VSRSASRGSLGKGGVSRFPFVTDSYHVSELHNEFQLRRSLCARLLCCGVTVLNNSLERTAATLTYYNASQQHRRVTSFIRHCVRIRPARPVELRTDYRMSDGLVRDDSAI